MQVILITTKGNYTIAIEEGDKTVRDLKNKIEGLRKIPVDRQRLTYCSKQLDDNQPIQELFNSSPTIIVSLIRKQQASLTSTSAVEDQASSSSKTPRLSEADNGSKPIKNGIDEPISMPFGLSDTLAQIKNEIQEQTGIPADEQGSEKTPEQEGSSSGSSSTIEELNSAMAQDVESSTDDKGKGPAVDMAEEGGSFPVHDSVTSLSGESLCMSLDAFQKRISTDGLDVTPDVASGLVEPLVNDLRTFLLETANDRNVRMFFLERLASIIISGNTDEDLQLLNEELGIWQEKRDDKYSEQDVILRRFCALIPGLNKYPLIKNELFGEIGSMEEKLQDFRDKQQVEYIKKLKDMLIHVVDKLSKVVGYKLLHSDNKLAARLHDNSYFILELIKVVKSENRYISKLNFPYWMSIAVNQPDKLLTDASDKEYALGPKLNAVLNVFAELAQELLELASKMGEEKALENCLGAWIKKVDESLIPPSSAAPRTKADDSLTPFSSAAPRSIGFFNGSSASSSGGKQTSPIAISETESETESEPKKESPKILL